MENSPIDCTENRNAFNVKSISTTMAPQSEIIPVIRQIEQNAERYPDSPALIFKEQTLSYADLISSARRVAIGLKHFGALPKSRVIVMMNPCPELVSSLLAIHMLGATYVPIDPSFPSARIEMIIEDIEPTAIVCDDIDLKVLREKLSDNINQLLIPISGLVDAAKDSRENFTSYPTALDDESHIFFTSGTTGRPKGAVSSQRNLAHGMSSSAHCFDLKRDHSILSVAGSSFSISTFELLSLLTCGGYTSIAQRSDILSIERLFGAAKGVSVLHMVPTLLARLIDFIEQSPDYIRAFSSIQRILTGGDNVPPHLLGKIRRLFPSAKLYVNYGASETNCMVTYWPVLESTLEKTKIGLPQENVKLLVLDKHRNPVIPGNVGELFVSSPGVIPGYIHRDDLNAEKFVEIDGYRYFASGDMVRIDENGLYEMLGREDFQIQLNGNRIELLEVESTLRLVPGINDCLVTSLSSESEEQTAVLAAYIVVSRSTTPTINEIKSVLRDYLPDYMVPSLYLLLDKVPTNHNGKVDRINLPKPGACQVIGSNPEEPLHGPVEQCIATIWSELLTVPPTHRNSDFFELGGDSIKAVQAMAKITAALGCQVNISDLVLNTTVKALADLIAEKLEEKCYTPDFESQSNSGCILLKQGNSDLSPILLINGVVEYLELAKALQTDRSIYAIYLPEEVDLIVNGANSSATESTDSIANITKLYLSLISELQSTGPYFLVGKSFGGIIAIEVARELENLGKEVSFIGLLDTVVPEAFTAHKRLSFRISEHVKKTFQQGPGYLVSRLSSRYFRHPRITDIEESNCEFSPESNENIRIRHQVRKSAIFSTRISPINRPITLIKARDRKYLYGERPTRDLGWGKYCNDLTVQEVPGDHHSILSALYVDNVARKLEPHLH